jgi:very-short-patch-repair endonuclease
MRADPTPAERRLWSMPRDRGMLAVKSRRQHARTPCIVDFACLERSPIIEADGGQQADNKSDRKRGEYLRRRGLRVLHFWNNDVIENCSGVSEAIAAALHTPHPPTAAQWVPPAPFKGEGLSGVANG